MGSSYRQDLQSGYMKDWEESIKKAIALVGWVEDRVINTIGDDGQYDNAASDGGLAERLSIVIRLLEETLPAVGKRQS